MISTFVAVASLALALASPDRVVVASDSRTWDRTCDCAGGVTARKVDIRDGYAFMMTGDPRVWAAWQATTPRPTDTPRTLADRVLRAVARPDGPSDAALGLLHVGPPVSVYVARVRLTPDGAEIIEDAAPSPPVAFALGWDDGGAERDQMITDAHRSLATDATEGRLLTLARSILDAAAAQSPKVGGPIHLAVLDDEGARWHGQDLHWDGTRLVISSGNLVLDDTSIRLIPGPVVDAYALAHAFAWDVGTGALGTAGWDTPTGRGLTSRVDYTGASTNPYVVTSQLQANYAPSSGGTQASASVNATSTNLGVQVQLLTQRGGTPYIGEILIGGVPDFLGATSGSAGSVAGYLHITIDGTPYRLPFHAP